MEEIVRDYVTTYYDNFGRPPPFNVISIAHLDDDRLECSTEPEHLIARPMMQKLHYCPKEGISFPVTSFDQVMDKSFVNAGVDRCRWNAKDCAFKRIEVDRDVKDIGQEIKSREKLLEALNHNREQHENADEMLEKRFNILPLLAIVNIKDDGGGHKVKGILMPFGGQDLENVWETASGSTTSPSSSVDLGITIEQLRDLTCGVRELARAGVMHGDICDRNILKKPTGVTTADGTQAQHRLILIDLGSVAPEYKNDAFALGQVFLWCKEHSLWDSKDQRKLEDAARVLMEDEDFDRAVNILGTRTGVTRSGRAYMK
jgi:serine/threonine protein kinase